MLPCWVALSLNFMDVSLRLTCLDSFLVRQNCQQKPSDVLFKSALLRKFILITICIKELIRLNLVTSCKICQTMEIPCKLSFYKYSLYELRLWAPFPSKSLSLSAIPPNFCAMDSQYFWVRWDFQSLPRIPDGIIWVLYSPLHSLFDA